MMLFEKQWYVKYDNSWVYAGSKHNAIILIALIKDLHK